MITVQAKGIQYEQIISIECGTSLGALARDFIIVIANPANRPLPFQGGEDVVIEIDDELFLVGIIFKVTPSYSKDNHIVTMTGRSRAADFIDSTLLPFSFTADTSLLNAIKFAVNQIGVDILVVNRVVGLKDFSLTEDKIAAEVGENAFLYANKLAKKRQTLLTSDANGDITITRAGTNQLGVSLRNIINGDSNILSGEVSYDLSKRFANYVVMSQLNQTASFSAPQNPTDSVDQRGKAADKAITRPRQLVITAEKASSAEQCQERATWEGNIRRAQSRTYKVSVQGFRPKGGDIWDTNNLISVNDEYAGINEVMLIDSVRFKQSKSAGTITQLGLVEKDSYTVSLQEPPPVKKKESGFANF